MNFTSHPQDATQGIPQTYLAKLVQIHGDNRGESSAILSPQNHRDNYVRYPDATKCNRPHETLGFPNKQSTNPIDIRSLVGSQKPSGCALRVKDMNVNHLARFQPSTDSNLQLKTMSRGFETSKNSFARIDENNDIDVDFSHRVL